MSLLDDPDDDPEERRRQQEAREAAQNLGAVLGLAAGCGVAARMASLASCFNKARFIRKILLHKIILETKSLYHMSGSFHIEI